MLQTRPITRTRSSVRVVRGRRRRWDRVSWWYSLLLLLPLGLIVADRQFGWSPVEENASAPRTIAAITLSVTDAETKQPLADAVVRAGEASAVTDATGRASLPFPSEPVVMTVSRDGYEPVYGTADGRIDREQTVALTRRTTDPNRDASADDEVEAPAAADETEEDAEQASSGDEASAATETDQRQTDAAPTTAADDAAAGSSLRGTVTDAEGEPIRGAAVSIGKSRTTSKRDGSFLLKNAPKTGEVRVFAPGYAEQLVERPASGELDVALALQPIKAIYLNGHNAGNEDVVDEMIRIANETEVNAIVVDIKEGYIFYDTEVAFFRDAKAVQPTYDPADLVKRLHDNDIYAIARLVVFNDPIVAENRPDLAVQTDSGDIWRGWMGDAWVNPFHQELWQPNIDLAIEAASLGFDEIQYDYIRFPSDGDLRDADFGPNYTEEGRVAAIVDFLKESKKQLEPTGAKLAVDIFGIVAIYPDDQGIGQRIADVAPYVDYVCPMIYPSHFDASSINVGGEPNDFPYETIQLSLALAKQRMPGMELKLRPWLQDFTLPPLTPYGADEVRAQIRASDEEGASGWMLWNAANDYTERALEPEE